MSLAIRVKADQATDQELIHLLHDQPMYFLLGLPNTKIQISFKAKILQKTDFYFAFNQRIFWDLFEKSSPFRDITYNPSFFYRFRFLDSKSSLDLIAYEHESNGKGDRKSRSWDRVGVRYQSQHQFSNGWIGNGSVRVWLPFNYDESNTNIAQYRGIYEFIFSLSGLMNDNFDLHLRLYPGGYLCINPLQGGQELTFRFKGKGSSFLVNPVFQVFHGTAENLVDYQKETWGIRAGLGI